MFVEALAPIGESAQRIINAGNRMSSTYDSMMSDQFKALEKEKQAEDKSQMALYRAETARMNAENHANAIEYANRLADMAEQKGVHASNMAGMINDTVKGVTGGLPSPVQVQIGPQPINYR